MADTLNETTTAKDVAVTTGTVDSSTTTNGTGEDGFPKTKPEFIKKQPYDSNKKELSFYTSADSVYVETEDGACESLTDRLKTFTSNVLDTSTIEYTTAKSGTTYDQIQSNNYKWKATPPATTNDEPELWSRTKCLDGKTYKYQFCGSKGDPGIDTSGTEYIFLGESSDEDEDDIRNKLLDQLNSDYSDNLKEEYQGSNHIPGNSITLGNKEYNWETDYPSGTYTRIWKAQRYKTSGAWERWTNLSIKDRKSASSRQVQCIYTYAENITESNWTTEKDILKNNIQLCLGTDNSGASYVDIPTSLNTIYLWADTVDELTYKDNAYLYVAYAYFDGDAIESTNSEGETVNFYSCNNIDFPVKLVTNNSTGIESLFITLNDRNPNFDSDDLKLEGRAATGVENSNWKQNAADNAITELRQYQFISQRQGYYKNDDDWQWYYNGKLYTNKSETHPDGWNYGWSKPVLWSVWGEDGNDGFGQEFIYAYITEEQQKTINKEDEPWENWEEGKTYPTTILSDGTTVEWQDGTNSLSIKTPYLYCWSRRTEKPDTRWKKDDENIQTTNIKLWGNYSTNHISILNLSPDQGSYSYSYKTLKYQVVTSELTTKITYTLDGVKTNITSIKIGNKEFTADEDKKAADGVYTVGNINIKYILTKPDDYTWQLAISDIYFTSGTEEKNKQYVYTLSIPISGYIAGKCIGSANYKLIGVKDVNKDGVYSYTLVPDKSNVYSTSTSTTDEIKFAVNRTALVEGSKYAEPVRYFLRLTDLARTKELSYDRNITTESYFTNNGWLTIGNCKQPATLKVKEKLVRDNKGLIAELWVAGDADYALEESKSKVLLGDETNFKFYYTGVSATIFCIDLSSSFTSGSFIVTPDSESNKLTANFKYKDSLTNAYYKIIFNNGITNSRNLIYQGQKSTSTDEITIAFDKDNALGGNSAATLPTVNPKEFTGTIENAAEGITLEAKDIAWLNCANVTVQGYATQEDTKPILQLSIPRTGLDGYFWSVDDSGLISVQSNGTTISALTQTADTLSSIITSGENFCIGGRCDKIDGVNVQSSIDGTASVEDNKAYSSKYVITATGLLIFKTNGIKAGKQYYLYYEGSADTRCKITGDSDNYEANKYNGFIAKQDNPNLVFAYEKIPSQESFTVSSVMVSTSSSGDWKPYDAISKLEQTVDKIQATVGDTAISVQDGEIVAKVDTNNTQSTGLTINKNGSTFTGKVAATAFQLNKAVNNSILDLSDSTAIMWLTTWNQVQNSNITIRNTAADAIPDSDFPVFLIKSGSDYYVLNPLRINASDTEDYTQRIYYLNNNYTTDTTLIYKYCDNSGNYSVWQDKNKENVTINNIIKSASTYAPVVKSYMSGSYSGYIGLSPTDGDQIKNAASEKIINTYYFTNFNYDFYTDKVAYCSELTLYNINNGYEGADSQKYDGFNLSNDQAKRNSINTDSSVMGECHFVLLTGYNDTLIDSLIKLKMKNYNNSIQDIYNHYNSDFENIIKTALGVNTITSNLKVLQEDSNQYSSAGSSIMSLGYKDSSCGFIEYVCTDNQYDDDGTVVVLYYGPCYIIN